MTIWGVTWGLMPVMGSGVKVGAKEMGGGFPSCFSASRACFSFEVYQRLVLGHVQTRQKP